MQKQSINKKKRSPSLFIVSHIIMAGFVAGLFGVGYVFLLNLTASTVLKGLFWTHFCAGLVGLYFGVTNQNTSSNSRRNPK